MEELGKIIDPAVWAQESFRIAQNITYPHIFKTNQLDEEYTTLAYETSRKRITLAGYRLAHWIVDIYKKAIRSGNLVGSQESSQESVPVVEKNEFQWRK